jgi:hypothetical protein
MVENTNPSSWLKLISKKDFEQLKGKYEFKNENAKAVVSGASENDALALRITTGSGLKILGAKILNEDNPQFFAELMSKGVEAI